MFKRIVRTGSYFHAPRLSGHYCRLLFSRKRNFLSSLTTNLACLLKKYFAVSTRSFSRLQAYRFTPWSTEKYLNINTSDALLCKSVVQVLFCTFSSLHYYILLYNLKEEEDTVKEDPRRKLALSNLLFLQTNAYSA